MLNRSGLCMRLFGLEMFPCYPESSDCFPLATVNYLNQQSLWNKQRSRQPFLSIQTELRYVRGETLVPTLELYLYNSPAVVRGRSVFRHRPLPNRVIRSLATFAPSGGTHTSDPCGRKFHFSASGHV